MSEPVSGIAFDSMIDQVYPKAPFTEQKFMVRAVLPEHTFDHDTLYPATLNIIPPASVIEQG